MIYLLEDDESIRKLVIYALESQGYEIRGFENPREFRAAMSKRIPDLLLLDIMLPGEDGISILKKLRREPATASLPVIMLTAKNTEFDKVEGLDAGADDYLCKPFGIMEMTARVRALLRRVGTPFSEEVLVQGDLQVFPKERKVLCGGKEIFLTYKEYTLLQLFMENREKVLTRDILLEKVWDMDYEPGSRTLDVHIRTLRTKLGECGKYIQTIRNVGYRFSGEDQ